jgi:4-hydroxy-2-oxoheptanedioate aldolase
MTSPVAALAARTSAGTPSLAAWCGIPEPQVAELLVREGFDCAVLDMQHGGYDIATATAGITAVTLAGKPAVVRIPVGEFSVASRMLDMGAAGIIAPMVNSIEDARRLASFAKLPPVGERSWGPARALAITGLSMGEYLARANGFSLAIAMIETRAALAALDDILAVDGIDGVFVGPSDLSIALSDGSSVNQLSPQVDSALDHIARRAKAAGKLASAFCADGKRAAEVIRKGYSLVSIGTDGLLVRAGAKAEIERARAMLAG